MAIGFKAALCAAAAACAVPASAASYYSFAFKTEGYGGVYYGQYDRTTVTTLNNITLIFSIPVGAGIGANGGNSGYGYGGMSSYLSYTPQSIAFRDTSKAGRYETNSDIRSANACIDYGPVSATPNLGFFVSSPGCGSALISTDNTFFTSTAYTGRVVSVTVSLLEDVPEMAQTTFVNGVPEPSTWALMLAGFGLVGYAMRKRAKVAYA